MIYLDYNATTPIAKEVADAMLPFIYGNFGNPSSSHNLGIAAKKSVKDARKHVAALIGCSTDELIFTSGGSESNNTVIKSVASTLKHRGNHIITSVIEHPAILNPCTYLEENGYEITHLPVDEFGMVRTEDLENAITDKTILVTIMHSNNETGTLQPIKEIAEICRKKKILFHTDASQSLGKVPVNVKKLDVDFLTIAGHKLYAPKGVGALFIRKGITIEPLIHGADHEKGRRAGTENVIYATALGKACEIAQDKLKNDDLEKLTQFFFKELQNSFGDKIKLNGHPFKRLPNTLNVSFIGFNAQDIITGLGDVAISRGSACHSGLTSISPVLKAMGLSEEEGAGAIRFSLGRYTTKKEIEIVLSRLRKVLFSHDHYQMKELQL
jgi:cysteine desulfurase